MSDSFTDLPDLASEDLGGAALFANDEFFAEKENLLRARPAEWREHAYTDRGKWMDGWESRRRREPGHDFCVIRLGLPGVIRGVVVDTAFFRGNFPESCSIDACELSGPLDLAQLADAPWETILPRAPLAGDTKNAFAIASTKRFTHVRLNIFPDGGVARLRVHGEVVPDWNRLRALGGPIDLAALEHGARVVSCSDMFFGSRHNLTKPGRSLSMADGWETKRRRGPGHDWALVQLAAPGTIRRVELDTSHFKGNAPGRCLLEVSRGEPFDWRPLLASPLQPHTRHVFEDELRAVGPVTHARLNVYPDGGVARLRLYGDLVRDEPGIARLNALPADEAAKVFRACCGAARFAEQMTALRAFEDLPALIRAADRVWWSLEPRDWLEAFAAHPQIGGQATSKWAAEEQAGARTASAATTEALAAENRKYFEKFGFVFLVCATGRSADDMLALLRERIAGTKEGELRTAAEEQAKITHLRLRKWVNQP